MTTTELLDAILKRQPSTPAAAVKAAIALDEEQYHLIAAKEARAGLWRRLNRRRSQLTRDIQTVAELAAAGQVRLFDPGDADVTKLLRTQLIDPDTAKPVMVAKLTGHEAAKLLRRVVERDMTPALTTVNRCRFYLRLADHVEEETERSGRDVSVAEVVGWKKAA